MSVIYFCNDDPVAVAVTLTFSVVMLKITVYAWKEQSTNFIGTAALYTRINIDRGKNVETPVAPLIDRY